MKIQITTEFGQKGLMMLNNDGVVAKGLRAGTLAINDLICGYNYSTTSREYIEEYGIWTKKSLKEDEEFCKSTGYKFRPIADEYNLRDIKELKILDDKQEEFTSKDYELMESLR